MSEGGPLINLGEISKPATVLIEKISDAIGAVFRPHQIKRVAAAEAEAEKIRALAQIEISEIQHRALVRMIQEEGQKQANIEQISARAIGELPSDAKPEDLEKDWLANFFEKCKLVSDAEMQTVWARLLAGEATRPGSFSKRTVELVSTLDKADAELFTTLCRFGWIIGNVTPLVFDVTAELYTAHGINFGSLTHLDSIGLISFNNIGGFVRKKLPKNITVRYYGTPLCIEFASDANNDLALGNVLLTQAGHQLAPISGSEPVDGFITHVIQQWVNAGLVVYSPLPNSSSSGRAEARRSTSR